MDRNRCWPLTNVALVILAAACAGNARTPLVTDLPPNLEVVGNAGTIALANPCAVNDHMPVVKDSTVSVPIPNGAADGFKSAVRMPNPCIVEETRK